MLAFIGIKTTMVFTLFWPNKSRETGNIVKINANSMLNRALGIFPESY